MLKNNILAKLMQGGQTDARFFPWHADGPSSPNSFMPGEPTVPDTSPFRQRLQEMADAQLSASGITPPYAQPVNDPMHGNAGAMAKYGRPAPGAAIPLGGAYPADESHVEIPANSPMNAAGFDRSILETPTLVLNKKEQRTADRDAYAAGAMTPTQRDRMNAEYDYENPEDKDQGWKGRVKEAISNFLYGMSHAGPDTDWKAALALGGIGAAGGLAKKTWNEQREAGAKIPYLRQKEQYESQQMDAQVRRDNTIFDNQNKRAELERKREADANKAAYYKGLLEDKKLGRELQDYQIADLRTYREFLMSNGVRNTDARIKQIEAKLEDADLDRKSREMQTDSRIKSQEKIAGLRESSTNRRQQIAIEAQKVAAAVQAAETAGRQKEAIEARERLAKLKAEDDALKNQ